MKLFGFEANDQATPNPGKDQTLLCQSFKKEGTWETYTVMVHINEHHAELYVEAISVHNLETKQLE